MKRALLALVLLLAACGPTLTALPRPPQSGWKGYLESGVTIRLPASWRAVDAAHLPSAADVAQLKSLGDPLGDYLETMSKDIASGTYLLEAVDPATVSTAVPFANSAYLAYVPGIATTKPSASGASPAALTPEDLLVQNLEATKSTHRLAVRPIARPVAPPPGFARAWEIEYAWEAIHNGTNERAQLAGLHYLLLRGDDAWILGFTAMKNAGLGALPTWRQVAGGISTPPVPAPFPLVPLLALVGLALAFGLLFLVVKRQRKRRRAEAAARERARRPRRWAR